MVQRGVVKLQYAVTKEQIVDVLTNPLARVKFEYIRENLGVLQIEVPSKESDEFVSHYDKVRGLVPSMFRCKCRYILM